MSRQALQALDKILQYKREDRKADIQQSLAFMQFAVQKRAADVQVFGKQMEVLKNANDQAKISVAKNFIQNSNLSEIYTSIPTEQGTDIEEIGSNLKSITDSINKTLKKGGLKDTSFRKQKSEEIASALWNFKTSNDPSSIVNIASGVNKSINAFTNKTANLQDKNLIKSFNILGNIANLKNVSQMASNVKLNDSNILKEQFEFVKGDTKIQSGFGMLSDNVVKEYQQKTDQKPDDKLSNLADGLEAELDLDSDKDPTASKLNQYNNLTNLIKEDTSELKELQKLKNQGYSVNEDRLKSLSLDIKSNMDQRIEIEPHLRKEEYNANIQRNVDKIELLAEKILEKNNVELNDQNFRVAKQKAAEILRSPSPDQFRMELDPSGPSRPWYDQQGKIQR